ncbi:MAG: hypothetical protein KME26_30380 [Oscillatoria princeps RMCB-10]|nr:hypothetical protein [Oscillatoria princeps RMCB-10]
MADQFCEPAVAGSSVVALTGARAPDFRSFIIYAPAIRNPCLQRRSSYPVNFLHPVNQPRYSWRRTTEKQVTVAANTVSIAFSSSLRFQA